MQCKKEVAFRRDKLISAKITILESAIKSAIEFCALIKEKCELFAALECQARSPLATFFP